MFLYFNVVAVEGLMHTQPCTSLRTPTEQSPMGPLHSKGACSVVLTDVAKLPSFGVVSICAQWKLEEWEDACIIFSSSVILGLPLARNTGGGADAG